MPPALPALLFFVEALRRGNLCSGWGPTAGSWVRIGSGESGALNHRLFFLLLAVCAWLPAARADSVVVFNEIMYHPATNEAGLEWVELQNEMSVDVDLSGWRLTGGVDYTFPDGTVIRGGGYVVVSAAPGVLREETGLTNVFGPFSGRL